MSTRFTATEKWNDKWFRSLSPTQKLIFIYLCDTCNLAGFIEVDYDKISFDTGLSSEEILGAMKGLARGYFSAGDWIWIKNFLKHQKNLPLNEKNNAHKHIISKIIDQQKNFDILKIAEYLGANQGLFSPIGKGIGNGKGREGGLGETNGEQIFFSIEHCLVVAMNDTRWVRANKTSSTELKEFNTLLEQRGVYQKNPADYKTHFANWKRSGKKDSALKQEDKPYFNPALKNVI